MKSLLALTFSLQGLLMFIDEFYFHRKRGLGRWERWGHPLDTFAFFLALASVAAFGSHLFSIILAVFSCLIITKDEWVHARVCKGTEQWLHSMLFVLHPVVLVLVHRHSEVHQRPEACSSLWLFLTVPLAFFIYQLIYWNFYANRTLRA